MGRVKIKTYGASQTGELPTSKSTSIKRKKIDLNLNKLKNLENEISGIKHDPDFYVDKSSERICFLEVNSQREISKKRLTNIT